MIRRMTTHRTLFRISLLGVILLAFGLAAAASQSPFERLPHLEDEVAYLWQARVLASGQLTLPTTEPAEAYWQPFVVDYGGQRFGKYPPGWPLLLAVGVLLGQPWIVNAGLAALTVALTYRLGHDLFGPWQGLLAALLTAISPLSVLLSGTLMSHTAATFWAMLMALALVRLVGPTTRHHRAWAITAGIALGMLANTRPLTALGVFLPFALGGTLIAIHAVWPLLSKRDTWRYLIRIVQAGPLARRIMWSGVRVWTSAQQPRLVLAGLFALSAVVTLLLTPLYNTAATGNPTANLYRLVWDYDRIGFGPEIGRVGHTPARALENLQHDVALLGSDLFGWEMDTRLHDWLADNTGWIFGPGLSLLLPLGGLIALRRQRWTWLLAGMAGGLATVHLLYWAWAHTYGPRYYAEAVPALALLAAAGLVALARRTRRHIIAGLLVVLIALSLLTYTPARLAPLWRLNNVGQDHIAALDTLRDDRPVLILVTGAQARSWRDWGTYMALTTPDLTSPVVAARVHGLPGQREAIQARFPDRQILELTPEGVLLLTAPRIAAPR